MHQVKKRRNTRNPQFPIDFSQRRHHSSSAEASHATLSQRETSRRRHPHRDCAWSVRCLSAPDRGRERIRQCCDASSHSRSRCSGCRYISPHTSTRDWHRSVRGLRNLPAPSRHLSNSDARRPDTSAELGSLLGPRDWRLPGLARTCILPRHPCRCLPDASKHLSVHASCPYDADRLRV